MGHKQVLPVRGCSLTKRAIMNKRAKILVQVCWGLGLEAFQSLEQAESIRMDPLLWDSRSQMQAWLWCKDRAQSQAQTGRNRLSPPSSPPHGSHSTQNLLRESHGSCPELINNGQIQ